jgi:hypothetical protein
VLGRLVEGRLLEELARVRQGVQVIELVTEDREVDLPDRRRNGAVDRAVDAVEVSDRVGVEVDPDRQALGPAGDHGIDVAVLLPGSGVLREEGEYGHGGKG